MTDPIRGHCNEFRCPCHEALQLLIGQLLKRGQACAVDITGYPGDVDEEPDIGTPEKAWAAIDEALRLGIERNNKLNALRIKFGSVPCGRVLADGSYCNLGVGHLPSRPCERLP